MAHEVDPVLISGGTDLMVAVNGRRRFATTFVSLRHAADLTGITASTNVVRIGAMTSYATLVGRPAGLSALPMLSDLAGRLGTPAQRNAGTIGGGVGSARWNGDAIAALTALGARLDVVSSTSTREVAIESWIARTDRAPDDVIRSIVVPVPTGPQVWLRVAERATAAEALATLALVVDVTRRTVRCVVGSVARSPIRATGAEALLTDALDWSSPAPAAELCQAFGAAVRDDVVARSTYRASESHRKHLAGVLAVRALSRAFA
ncbi:xanthine dehydrogenase family protein subunit M [Acidothermaceae bacterium B102]|nr:xanthine dehydrogenase family protein subunit M [Acidothermaceae bacterium B102]